MAGVRDVVHELQVKPPGEQTLSCATAAPNRCNYPFRTRAAGSPPNNLPESVDAFRQASATPDGGVGLGLAIVSRAARLMGVRLSVESRLGRGAKFSLTLPRHPLPESHS